MEDNVTEKRMENKMTDPLQTFKESAREIATELHDTGGHYLLTDKQFDALTAAAVELVKQVIGEDSHQEFCPTLRGVDSCQCEERIASQNDLRAAQRAALNKEDQDGN